MFDTFGMGWFFGWYGYTMTEKRQLRAKKTKLKYV